MQVDSFKEFVEKRKKYVCVEYDQYTQQLLRDWCNRNGFPLTMDYDGSIINQEQFVFHTTIFFSTTEHSMKNGEIPFSGYSKVVGFDWFGINKNIPVLKVESLQLTNARIHFELQGMKDSWEEYKPHITVSYSNVEMNYPESLPEFPLTFDRLIIDDISD